MLQELIKIYLIFSYSCSESTFHSIQKEDITLHFFTSHTEMMVSELGSLDQTKGLAGQPGTPMGSGARAFSLLVRDTFLPGIIHSME